MKSLNLPERLRDARDFLIQCRGTEPPEYYEDHARTCADGAHRIEALEAENKSLRKALAVALTLPIKREEGVELQRLTPDCDCGEPAVVRVTMKPRDYGVPLEDMTEFLCENCARRREIDVNGLEPAP